MSEKMEKWELQELVDEAVATGQITKEMINEYVYEMKVGGRWIMDLTAASYHQLALNRGITTEEIKREDMTDGVMYTVTVAQVEVDLDKADWQRRIGVSFEPFVVSGKFDRFCYQKALTKATRNGIKQLVSATERFDAMKALKEIPLTVGAKQDALPAPLESQQETQGMRHRHDDKSGVKAADTAADAKAAVKDRPDGESEFRTLQKRCFALYREHNSEVDNPKIETGDGRLPVDFWDNVRKRFGVQSRATMELRHWRECLQMIFDELRKAEVEADAKAESEADAKAESEAEKRDVEETRKVDDSEIPF